MDLRINQSILNLNIKTKVEQLFSNLFEYDEEKLTIIADDRQTILNNLNQAFLSRDYILMTFTDGHQQIVTVKNLIKAGRTIIAVTQNGLPQIVQLPDIFKIEFAN